jgi:hypothetical protein
VPVQQPVPTEQASPGCEQKDDAWHVPAVEQYPEAHWAADVQGLPTVALVGLSAAHFPPIQLSLQHSPFDPQAAVSAVHVGKLHNPPTQSALQQSASETHAALSARQAPLPIKTPAPSPPEPAPPLVPWPVPEPAPCPVPALPVPCTVSVPELLPVLWPKAPEPLADPGPPSGSRKSLSDWPHDAAIATTQRTPIDARALRNVEVACMRFLASTTRSARLLGASCSRLVSPETIDNSCLHPKMHLQTRAIPWGLRGPRRSRAGSPRWPTWPAQ